MAGFGVFRFTSWCERGCLHSAKVLQTKTGHRCQLLGDKAPSCLSSMKPPPVSLLKESGNFIHLLKPQGPAWAVRDGDEIARITSSTHRGRPESLEDQGPTVTVTQSSISRRSRHTHSQTTLNHGGPRVPSQRKWCHLWVTEERARCCDNRRGRAFRTRSALSCSLMKVNWIFDYQPDV